MDVPKRKQLSDLPSGLVTDILLRLPPETLLSCRYVCTAWDAFFTNPGFVEMQLAASPIHFLERQVFEENRAIHFGRVVKDDGKLKAQKVDFTPRLLDLPDPTYWCVNSSNGLLCLVGRDMNADMSVVHISVCNPLLGQSVSIPMHVNHMGRKMRVAIGFSAKDKLYKVLVGYQLNEEDEEWEEENDYGFAIYTLGTREWRVLDTVEGCTPWEHNGMDFNTFLHGSLHWYSVGLSTDGSTVRSLWSFNFENEKFQRLALPEAGGDDVELYVQIGIMNGCLWLLLGDHESPAEADIWVMKEYGVKDSWTHLFAFRNDISQFEVWYSCCIYPVFLYLFSHKDVLITDEEDPGKSHSVHVEKVLIADHYGELVCYNTKKIKYSVVEFGKRYSHTYFRCMTSYFPSFVSLQDVAKGEDVKVSRITYEAAQ